MHSSKFIQIRKERHVEQRLASIWLDACAELEIPCILVYEDHWNAYISLNLKFIPETLTEKLDMDSVQQQLLSIQEKYASKAGGYCNHNNAYHTFDAVPKEHARKVATEIYDTVMRYNLQQATSNVTFEAQLSA